MEDGNPVRKIQQHLRRAGALLSQRQFDAAIVEIDAALSIDPASLPAQALRERAVNARALASRFGATTASARPQQRAKVANPVVASHRPVPSAQRFVPSGVDEQSWLGFEQRVQERRFRALIEQVNVAVALNDGVAARVALEEARELRPDAPELAAVAEQVALLPTAIPDAAAERFLWMRAASAVGMLAVGVTLVVGLEWIRPATQAVAADAVTTPTTGAGSVAGEAGLSPAPPEAVSAEPASSIATPVATDEIEPEVEPSPEMVVRPEMVPPSGVRRISTYAVPAAAAPRPTFRAPVDAGTALQPRGEVPDDYVAPRPRPDNRPQTAPYSAAAATPVAPVTPAASIARQPAPLSPLVPPSTGLGTTVRADDTRSVTQVLNQYARAYGQLDASAARAVWPTVDERALARAFSGLESQSVSFDDCNIDVHGATANASCRGRASYRGKVGNRDVRVEPRTWQFDLKRDGDAWKIQTAEARRISN